jgi:hypothetical protein
MDPTIIDVLVGEDLSLEIDSFAWELTVDRSPTKESLELLMALRHTALELQELDLSVLRDHKVEIPLWALTSMFRSVLKRLR